MNLIQSKLKFRTERNALMQQSKVFKSNYDILILD